MKAKLAVDYSNENCKFEQADMNCEGCFSIKNSDSKMCGACKIRNCAEEKNYQKSKRWNKYRHVNRPSI